MTFPKFSGTAQSFHAELKKRISDYFKDAGKAPTGNFQLYFKAIFLVVAYVAVYTHLIFFTPATWLALTECVVLGGLTAAIGFNVMHDGMHGSFSKYKWVNTMAGLSLNFLGANNFMWKTKHNIIHHTYTNIEGLDDDIEAKPLLRLCDTQKYYKIHRFQHWYFWAAYSLLYIWWVFVTDYKKYFLKRIGSVPLKPMSAGDHISFWGFKLLHAFLFIALPIYVVGFTPWLIGFLIFGLFAGFVLSIVFQLAHTVEHTHFPHADVESNKMEDEWAIHQLKTTANFATRNKVISWLVGGLNFQVEHHLFPKVSHVHYPAISKIIKKACEDFGVTYIEYPKMRLALASHVSHLRNLSRK
ncbi:MAG TPA: acyl-CoA desaturase [Chitinophagaceae bacterium]|nr:acyl-CoA desaturase [Chitinophagaceae bacterium]HNU14870.1 acyl-CoA desaturase [Chitinophagaceae bacterium]